jgi:purine-binding chemotaxis protein CheW
MPESKQYLAFMVDGKKMAIETAQVIRVIRSCHINPLPQAPAGVQGVINISGKIIPVINLRLKAGMTIQDPSISDYIILLKKENFEFSLIVDSIEGITEGRETAISEPGEHGSGITKKALINGMEIVFINPSESYTSSDDLEFIDRLIKSGNKQKKQKL